MNNSRRSFGRWSPARVGWGTGVLAWLAVVLTLGDPGITSDEPLDVRPGRTYVEVLGATGWGFFRRETVDRVFADNAEHPSLGRWLLGIASKGGEAMGISPGGHDPFGVHSGRLAPALAFAALAGMIAATAARRYGTPAGTAAGLALILMPRMFAHAHFGALDTFLAFFWTAALLAADRALVARRPVAAMGLAGTVWGLAILTKIHGWLLPPVVLVWALYRLRSFRAFWALAAWGAAGVVVYIAGWPWLWYDSVARFRAYMGTGVVRTTLWVQYFGKVYPDRGVPWHYPWFTFAVAVPVGLHGLGVIGLVAAVRSRRTDPDPLPILLIGSILLFLVVFSTNVPVYDGERLFLPVFPLWAVVIGRGFGALWEWSDRRMWIKSALAAAFLTQGYGTATIHPFGLSYYNALVGGLPGAERLGLELTYWGDSVDAFLLEKLDQVASQGDAAALAPTLHHIQPMADTTPGLFRKQIRLIDDSAVQNASWLLVYRRTAYWKPGVLQAMELGDVVSERRRQGVWLSRLYRTRTRPPSRSEGPRETSARIRSIGIEKSGTAPYNLFRRD